MYLNDVILFSQNVVEHIKHVEVVLEALKLAGILLKIDKCEFLPQQVK